MTGITELAQREKFEAWWEREYKHLESSKYTDAVPHIKYGFWMAYQAGGAEMVEALEKAQAINAAAEKLVRCKGRYHSEQNYRALAALFGVKTPDLPPLEHENVHYADAAEMEIEALRQRIAELEESNAQVIQSRDHYKRMTEEGLKQLAEARTVKLPDLRQIVSGDRYVWSDGVYNYSQDVKVVLAAAGIKVEVE
ncbi:TPA: ead/Ea22-like family protein [Klebsiella pneumoniae]|nr:ead/Ea22-like family protein [Klebsiella pneumoniae]HBW5316040.1 ead/Ea22-like family protein [Klebsiella pneumoniae]HBW5552893.1 ead/Ea22-like family protein [Klebsiella pneumoniae]HDS4683255.1 ead/Ea22-like family protein [Klebsiella pneumoniae]HDS4696222.1 ead/Ea22-like family protein [Klebsiella pneumoniae subsp. pneumoniae]